MKIKINTKNIIPAIIIIMIVITLRITFLEIDTSFMDKYRNPIRYSLFVVVIAHAFYNYKKLDYKIELIIYICAIAIISIRNGGFNFLVIVCISAICFRYSDDFVAKILVLGEIIGAVYYFVLLAIGEIKSKTYFHKGNYAQESRVRITMGFSNVNLAGMFFLSLGFLIIMSRKGKSAFNWAVGLIIMFLGYHLTKARTAYLCALMFVFLSLISYLIFDVAKIRLSGKTKGKIEMLIDSMIVMIAILPLASGFIYKHFPYLNAFSTGRFYLYDRYINSFSNVTWLIGRPENAMVDCFTLVFIAKYGALLGIWTLLYIIQSINKLIYDGRYIEICYIFSIFFVDTLETYLLRLSDMMVILFWLLVFQNSKLCYKNEQM